MPPYRARKTGQARILNARHRRRERHLVDPVRGPEVPQRTGAAVRACRLEVPRIHIVAPLNPSSLPRSSRASSWVDHKLQKVRSFPTRASRLRSARRVLNVANAVDDLRDSASATRELKPYSEGSRPI